MIKVVKGNLLDATETIIAHQVNCQKKMNSGVAKAIREEFPIVFDRYCQTNPQLGLVDFIHITDKNKGGHYIANMYSQDMYGYDGNQYTDYEAFRQCCEKIAKECRLSKQMKKEFNVAMPYKIASDRGGADWDKIMDILLEEFTDVDLTLYKL
jgi:O-acetyl-ADP-ribose deacetylase (regulator of RNase III)